MSYHPHDGTVVQTLAEADVKHVHLKDVRREVLPAAVNNRYSFYQAIESGIFTVAGILQMLKEAGYYGWMIVEAEQDPTHANPVKYAKMAREYLRKQVGY